ncbi:MAG: signal recognition particle-docking protein FtsY, partial [Bdellovibrionota bacterium]
FARYPIKTDANDKEVFCSLKQGEDTPESAAREAGAQASAASDLKSAEASQRREALTPEAPKRFKTLEEALAGTKSSLWGRMASTFTASSTISDDLQHIEEVLFTSDLGPQTAQHLLEKVGDRLDRKEKSNAEKVRAALRAEMLAVFQENAAFEKNKDLFDKAKDQKGRGEIVVWMVVGVNGAGKTTTIGKLASLAQLQGLKPMIVAGDTFRAAADSQLRVWSERSGSLYYSSDVTKDPSAVAYQALEKAKSEKVDLVLIDTAGRLHTQDNLMEELKKMKRVMTKVIADAPHEVIIVLDANNGQNALEQARQFHKAVGISAAILTKLDGTSKGGVAVGLASELNIPIRFVGIGEGVEDLRIFSAEAFVDSII